MKNRSQYVRWPGDSDPSDQTFVSNRRYVQKTLSRGPKALRALIEDGYVSEIRVDPASPIITLFGPDGFHSIDYYRGIDRVAVHKSGHSQDKYFGDVRSAAEYFRALVDSAEEDHYESRARIAKALRRAISLSSWKP